jgi:hypothetical protein
LLQQVARRQAIQRWAARTAAWALAVGIAFALTVVAVRWFAPGWPSLGRPSILLSLVGLVVAVGALGARFGDRRAAARRVDAHLRADDLFLTQLLLPDAARRPELAPVVEADAQARAARVAPSAVAPLDLLPAAGRIAAALAIVALALWTAPFGAPATSSPAAPRPSLAKVEERIAALRKAEVEAPRSPPVEAALAELKRDLQAMQREQPPRPETKQQLKVTESKLAELWRENQRGRGAAAAQASSVGSGDRAKQNTWRKELADGKVDSLKQEVRDLAKRAAEAAKLGDQAAQAGARAQAREVRNFAQRAGASALDRAMADMLERMGDGKADESQTEDLAKLAELAELEADALRQDAADIAALEQAFAAAELAAALEQLGVALPEVDPAAALEDYAEQFGEELADELEGLEPCEDCEGGG